MLIQIALMLMVGNMQIKRADATTCFSCSNATDLPDCTTQISCPPGSACFAEYTTFRGKRLYTLGCKSVLLCPLLPTNSTSTASIVGRAVFGTSTCTECCNSSSCNRQLCQRSDPTCSDDPGYDCATFGAGFDICGDITHAKSLCRRFCGFCNSVDGNWSSWNAWSLCDVTCGYGTRTRSRSCSNPVPENGGSDCIGEIELHENCTREPCPIHGDWSQWSEWGLCSLTCDIGLQRRDRSCSNPYPAHNGDHCYGDSRSDRMCFPGACANGSWSTWDTWGSCTNTCDGGVKTRSRNCNNPAPSLTGKGCVGDPMQADSCNKSPCQGPVVFFAKTLSTLKPGKMAQLRFTDVITNVGKGYNSSSGYFEAPVNGSYSFNVQICVATGKAFVIDFFVNNNCMSSMQLFGDEYYACRTLSIPVLLTTGDQVHIKTGQNTDYFETVVQDLSRTNSFSGVLVQS